MTSKPVIIFPDWMEEITHHWMEEITHPVCWKTADNTSEKEVDSNLLELDVRITTPDKSKELYRIIGKWLLDEHKPWKENAMNISFLCSTMLEKAKNYAINNPDDMFCIDRNRIYTALIRVKKVLSKRHPLRDIEIHIDKLSSEMSIASPDAILVRITYSYAESSGIGTATDRIIVFPSCRSIANIAKNERACEMISNSGYFVLLLYGNDWRTALFTAISDRIGGEPPFNNATADTQECRSERNNGK